MSTLLEFLNERLPFELSSLAIAVAIGIAIIIFIRARQVVVNRRDFGYDVSTALSTRRRLLLLAIITVLLIGAGSVYFAWRTLTPQAEEIAEELPDVIPEPGDPLHNTTLLIPSLAIEAELIHAPFVANQWDISRLTSEIAHLEGTSYPGEQGNIVLAGHVTIPNAGWGPFHELDTLRAGDRIFIEQESQTLVYQVDELLSVEPTAVEVAFPTKDDRLTLITCSGWSDITENYTQRVVVVAIPVSSESTVSQ